MKDELLLLKIFKDSCSESLENIDTFYTNLAIIKKHFFVRDYLAIFNDPILIQIYAAAYSPGRALCFRNFFLNTPSLRDSLAKNSKVFCLGAGNGAELVGISSALKLINSKPKKFNIHVQDFSDNLKLLRKMEEGLKNEYRFDDSDSFSVEYSIKDLLDIDQEYISNSVECATLVTAFFILNELLASSKTNFVKLIFLIVEKMKKGSLFVVCDSAGSFSDIKIGENNYQCYDLLDGITKLECLKTSDSEWYRFPEKLSYSYPVKLNNMRYFLRVYRKI